jgi:hypothetical protein
VPVAKEILKIGSIVVARPGNFVARSAVEHYGWQDKVTDDEWWASVPPVVDIELPEEPAPQRRVRKRTR